ncbi:N-acetylglucosamine-6-phosphate deacetylase [Tunturibacter empetritectus]|uniref:N-acetylglucosamine-6-phosphate deacetylase n=1 Tax=Tunturiibacter empetritectus TaxID=3069691 RepID=UPI001618B72A|nr:N-acetylglucosamine-6-phosphate deacetylase [Edaphobacter lichenicola]
MISTIAARRLINSDLVVEYPLVTIEDGRISQIESLNAAASERVQATYSFREATLVPTYVDIHIHGCAGHDVMEADSKALKAIGAYLSSRGVGAYFPTTVTSPTDETLRSLTGLATEIRRWAETADHGATPLGIHLEGPFLSHLKRGVHTEALLEVPSVSLFDRFWQAAEGQIRLMTIAPELPGATELIAHATALGVRCSMGHSDARVCEAEAGFVAGARSATHTFNAMRAIDHREPGLAAYVLDKHSLFAEIICDGIHVDPLMVRLFFKAKERDRIILVTDGMSATGMPDGTYMLGDMKVEVHDGRCTSDGTLAGSVLTLDRGVQNLIHFTGANLETAVAAASRNPSRLMGIDDSWGSLEVGRAANITVLSPSAGVIQTFLSGRSMIA